MTSEERRLRALERDDEDPRPARLAHDALEEVLFELRRVIVGQDKLLERCSWRCCRAATCCSKAFPDWPRRRPSKPWRTSSAARSAAPVHARPGAGRPDRHAHLPAVEGGFATELGPVFANLVLADEINRAPAKVQSALLEVMQEHQVTIGKHAPRA